MNWLDRLRGHALLGLLILLTDGNSNDPQGERAALDGGLERIRDANASRVADGPLV